MVFFFWGANVFCGLLGCLLVFVATGLVCLHLIVGFYVYVSLHVHLGVFFWLRQGCVYRVGPSRAQISDPHIPEPPLMASVCCSL